MIAARSQGERGLSIADCRLPIGGRGPGALRVSTLLLAAWFAGSVCAPTALANIVITLEGRDADGHAIGDTVEARSVVSVDILLSVDEEDDPLLDLRTVQLDFEGTTAALALRDFHWILPPGVETDSYGQFEVLPRPRLSYATSSRVGNSIIDLDQTPQLVATIEVTVNGSGTLDLRNAGADQADEGLLMRAGFNDPIDFDLTARNVSGGTLRLTVAGGGGTDTDRDGVPDSVDAFPFNPNESLDTDDDGTGDNADRDDDGDGVADNLDAFPLDPEETLDTDGDGDGNHADTDDDDDGVPDTADACPLDAAETRDSDGDGICDNADPDSPDDRNTGPRVTGGLCGASVLMVFPWLMCGLAFLRRNGRTRAGAGGETQNHYIASLRRRRTGAA